MNTHEVIKIFADALPGGLGDDAPDSDFDKRQLQKGIKHELEHTDSLPLAKEITKDHVLPKSGKKGPKDDRLPDYYDRLDEVEKTAWSEGAERYAGWKDQLMGGLMFLSTFFPISQVAAQKAVSESSSPNEAVTQVKEVIPSWVSSRSADPNYPEFFRAAYQFQDSGLVINRPAEQSQDKRTHMFGFTTGQASCAVSIQIQEDGTYNLSYSFKGGDRELKKQMSNLSPEQVVLKLDEIGAAVTGR